MVVGLALFSQLDAETTTLVLSLEMAIVGLGLGCIMQVLILAVQNAVPYEQLGVATSGATLFRTIGGSLGTAILGAVFAAQLSANLARDLPPGAVGAASGQVDPAQVSALPEAVRVPVLHAYTDSMDTIFLVAAIAAILAFALAWLPTGPGGSTRR